MNYNAETLNLNGIKTSKSDNLIHFIGTADELNAYLGLVKALLANEDTWQVSWHIAVQFIEKIQKNIMKMMSHVSDSSNEKYCFSPDDVADIEKEITRLTSTLPKQKKFSMPGKDIIEAQIQIARTIARRTERMYAAIYEEKTLCPNAGTYLNRLSDYLYYLSQQESLVNDNFINQIAGI